MVTLIEHSYWTQLGEHVSVSESGTVWGAAYRIPPAHVREVKEYLDIREINGYSIQYTTFFPSGSDSQETTDSLGGLDLRLPVDRVEQPIPNCLVYIGLPNNPQFLGLQQPDAVAEVIARSIGPSGRNDEYLFMLEQALEGLHKGVDAHITDLAARVRRLGNAQDKTDDRIGQAAAEKEMYRVTSGHGGGTAEETEKTILSRGAGD